MYVDFDLLDPQSRIWVYQADRLLTEVERSRLEVQLQQFCRTWKAHGRDLRASFRILHNRFVLLGADESHNAASGCSIDTSVAALREIGRALGIDLLNRQQVAFLRGDEVHCIALGRVRDAVGQGLLLPDTPVFNTLVSTAADLAEHWIKPAGNTWLARYFAGEKRTEDHTKSP